MDADEALENPYPGLRPFHADEAHLFFGRDAQTTELLRRLQRTRFLAIVGTSGSGKSSLVRAGLLQGLYGGLMTGGSRWRVVDLRPGTDPIGNLVAALDRPGALTDEGRTVHDSYTDATLRRSALGLIQAVREAHLPRGERVLVLVDQFEELFRALQGGGHAHLADDASAFVKLLLEAAQQDPLPIYVALTMRSDFLGESARFRGLAEAISDGQYLIPRLTRDQMREAITGPAGVHGVALSPTLVNRLLNDVGDNPDQLPILQHALMRTWNLWASDPAHGKAIDLPDYERIGGMGQALSRHADEVLHGLDNAGQRIARYLFKALATLGAGGQEVRRFAAVQEVADIAGAPVADVIAVVEAFRAPGNSFLMPPVGEALSAHTALDISHESLIRNWRTVRAWLDEEAESARVYERLATTAALHAAGQAGLWSEPDLGIALAWRARQRPTATWARRYDEQLKTTRFRQAMEFLDDSHAKAAQTEAHRRGRRRLRAIGAALALVAMLLLVLDLGADEIERGKAQAEEVKRTLAGLSEVAKLEQSYRDLLQSDWDPDKCRKTFPTDRALSDFHPGGALQHLCEQPLQKGQTDPALDLYFKLARLLAEGRIDEADHEFERALNTTDYADRVSGYSDVMFTALGRLQSPDVGRERLALVALWRERSNRAAVAGLPGGRRLGVEKFLHPVHQAIAAKLLAQPAVGLSDGEGYLLKAYQRLESDIPYRNRMRNWTPMPDGGESTVIDPEDSTAPTTLPAVADQDPLDAADASADDTAKYRFTYTPMVVTAAQDASAGLALLLDRMQTFALSFLVLLAWPAWRVRRGWQRRRGRTLDERAGAWRRALAAVYDIGLAVGLFFLGGWAVDRMLTLVGAPPGVVWLLPVAFALLLGLGYLLLSDAIRLRYSRSLGKAAFDLRPVMDGVAEPGAIGVKVSLRRNAPSSLLAVVVTVLVVAEAENFETLLEGMAGISSFPLMAVLWLAIKLMPGRRTLGDRWSRTRVIDSDSAASLAAESPRRYIDDKPETTPADQPAPA